MDERLVLLRKFGLHRFPADTTPGECADLFNRWVLLNEESFPTITAKAIGPLLRQLGFKPIGWKQGRVRLFNPHYKELPI